MGPSQIRFEDGTAYERYMGAWSQLAGAAFLDWLDAPTQLRWLDVGCGNGAFTELILERCAPSSVAGVDPSDAQLAYARKRFDPGIVELRNGDAMALPLDDDAFGVAVMPLVIFFLPDPAAGVAEMARVVCGGGIVSAYAWDMIGGGFPYEPVRLELRRLEVDLPTAPSPDASRIEVLEALWIGAGLEGVETREIVVQRAFADFEEYWETILGAPSMGRQLAGIAPEALPEFKMHLRERLSVGDGSKSFVASGRANAVKGRVPR